MSLHHLPNKVSYMLFLFLHAYTKHFKTKNIFNQYFFVQLLLLWNTSMIVKFHMCAIEYEMQKSF